MNPRRHVLATIAAGLIASSGALHALGLREPGGLPDPPADFFPGKYYEWKAQFYLNSHQYRAALDMFELSGFWADKMSQYNAGIMLFNGIGVPQDKARGVAWLRIAAESHEDLPVATYNAALVELSDAERSNATQIWHELDAKYGDKVSLPRAIDRYLLDAHGMTNFGIPDGNLVVSEVGGYDINVPAGKYMDRKKAELEALIKQITGTVKVGAVQSLDVANDAKRRASTKLIGTAAPSEQDSKP